MGYEMVQVHVTTLTPDDEEYDAFQQIAENENWEYVFDPLKHKTPVPTKYENWKQTILPKGQLKFIYVNRQAIQSNINNNTSFPTILIKTKGSKKRYQFHAVIICGTIGFNSAIGFERDPEVDANVYLRTRSEVLCLRDPAAQPWWDFYKTKKISWLERIQKIFQKPKDFLTSCLKS